MNNQVHVFHWNCTQQNFVTKNESAHETLTFSKRDLEWPNIRAQLSFAAGYRHFALVTLQVKAQLDGDVFRDTKMKRTRIHERCNRHRR